MIIKSVHLGKTNLKHVSYLIRLSEEREFIKYLNLELLRDILKSPTNRKLSYDLSYKFKAILTSLRKDQSFPAGGF